MRDTNGHVLDVLNRCIHILLIQHPILETIIISKYDYHGSPNIYGGVESSLIYIIEYEYPILQYLLQEDKWRHEPCVFENWMLN